eukprot:430150_1
MADISLKEISDNNTQKVEYAKLSGPKKFTPRKNYTKLYVTITVTVCIIMLVVGVVAGIHGVNLSKSKTFRSGPPVDNPTHPYWLQNAPFQNISTGEFPNNVDITIIGAGMSGTSILYHLVKYLNENISSTNRNILLIDARGASGGATGRNGGIMGILGAEGFNSTLANYGVETALARYNFSKRNIYDIIQFIEDNNIDANLRLNPSIATILSNDSLYLQSIKNIINTMQNDYNIGFENKLLNTFQMRNMSKSNIWTNGIYKNLSYIFWPAKVVFGLLNYSILHTNNTLSSNNFESNLNLNIQFNKVVNSVSFDSNNEKWIINTRDNNIVHSNIIIYATNGYTSYLLPEYSSKIYPAKNQVIISKIINESAWNNVGGFGDSFEYYNQRVTGRILIGGGRQYAPSNWINNFNDSNIDKNIETYLQNYLYSYYPQIKENQYMNNFSMQWQGIMGFTNDGLPYIGPIVNKKNAYICAGYTGSGMTYAFNGGKAIANMIMNKKPNPFVNQFLPESRE